MTKKPQLNDDLNDVPKALSGQQINYINMTQTKISQTVEISKMFSTRREYVGKAFRYTTRNGTERDILAFIAQHDSATYQHLDDHLNASLSTIQNAVSKLSKEGLLSSNGNPATIQPRTEQMRSIIMYALDATDTLQNN